MAVELAITPDARWQCTPEELIRAAARAGFRGVGVRGDVDTASVNAVFAETGLRCHETLALTISKDAVETIATAERLAATAAAVHAPYVLTIFRASLRPEVADTIKRCAEIITSAGAAMAVEFSPLGPINSIAKGLEVVEAATAGTGRAGLMIDTWHFTFGPSTWEDLETVPLERVAYIQFNDGLEPISDDGMFETLDRRAMPGEGIFELDRFATTLLERGFEGVVSAEVLMAELLDKNADEIASRTYSTMARYWV